MLIMLFVVCMLFNNFISDQENELRGELNPSLPELYYIYFVHNIMYLFYIKIKTVESFNFIETSEIHSIFKNLSNEFKSRYEIKNCWF